MYLSVGDIIKLFISCIPMVLFAALLVIVYKAYLNIKRKIQSFSNKLYNTSSLIEGIKQTEQRVQTTPKSISGGDSMFIDKIMGDFPEFNLENTKTVISEAIAYIYSHNQKDIKKKYPELFLEDINSSHKFGKIHKIAISGYEKSYNDACIKFQVAYEVTVSGALKQLRAEVEYSFKANENISLKCPHCGAPVSKMGIKKCEFCGHGIVYDIDNTWQITKIKNLGG